MARVSRRYLREKWGSLKVMMEGYLEIEDEDLDDAIPTENVLRVLGSIEDLSESIITELRNSKV